MNDDLIEELRGNRNEVIQNGTCAYMSPRPYGLWVPWHLVEKTIEALEHSKSGTFLADPEQPKVCQRCGAHFMDHYVPTEHRCPSCAPHKPGPSEEPMRCHYCGEALVLEGCAWMHPLPLCKLPSEDSR